MQIRFLYTKWYINKIVQLRILIPAILFYSSVYFSHAEDENLRLIQYDSMGIAKTFLEMEREINPIINIEKYLTKIDSLTQQISCEMGTCSTIEDSIKSINQIFYEQKFIYNEACGFISDIFEKGCGNCLSFSALYFDIAERLGIKNIYAVMAPMHVFIRYERPGKKINIETTQKGKNFPDRWYLNLLNISENLLKSDIYFRNLSRQEFIAVLLSNRGSAFLTNKKIEKAMGDFYSALSVFPFAETYFGLARCYDNSGDKNRAIKAYDNSLQQNPEFVNAYCNRGLLLEQAGKVDWAIKDYNMAIQLKPDFAEVYYNRGIAYTIKKDFSQAIMDFTTAIEIKPKYADAYYNRGCAKNLAKEYSDAIQDYNLSIELGHKTANTYIYRGDCKRAMGDKQGACEDWKIGFEMGYKFNKKRILKYCKK